MRHLLQRWSARIFLVALALGACGVLYVKTRAVDFAAHAELVESLRRVQQLNAVLQQQVLAVRFGLLNEYDPLVSTKFEIANALADLPRRLAGLSYGTGETGNALIQLTEMGRRRALDVEQFKTQNAILKNSLYYLPTAGDALIAELTRSGSSVPEAFTTRVHGLVQNTLLHNLLKSEFLHGRIVESLSHLATFSAALPGAVAAQHALLLQHAQTVIRQQDLVDPLIGALLSADFDRAALRLAAAYARSFESAVQSANRYRIALYLGVVGLLVAVTIVGVKLRELYASLEIMVSDRTQRLEHALRELWGEMELAKKIQTALVPQKPALKNCEVAAVMLPADQVGGDYYDVVSIDGNEWILIGDVSGHGVPAGLVMMMCQTAVHTVLALEPRIAPAKLLTAVNHVLTENIGRLGEDKYMTINALCRQPDGHFVFSGMHQDIFIYRAHSRSIEEIRADGMCLGLSPTIEDLLVTGSFVLAEGDVLLLYTDGITEATRDGRMLDGAGLKEMLLELGEEGAEQIVKGIVARLSSYAVADDVTAIAIKQLRASAG